MEQQTISIAKAGIICTLNCRTAILAAANPVDSKYNPKLSVVDNIKLPPTLLSRFDLIYLLLDRSSPVTDRRLANHIVSLYGDEDPKSKASEDIDRKFLILYISYARQNIHPEISDLAWDLLSDKILHKVFKIITATPRLIESLIRLSDNANKTFSFCRKNWCWWSCKTN